MPLRHRVVAVIDDDAGMRKGIERLLQVHGLETELYASAEDFMAGQDTGNATCIVLDIALGGISGIELRRRMLALGSRVPTIFVTASDEPANVREADRLGCVACLLKPFPASELIEALGKALAGCPATLPD
jgi:FixJ family two-component response regulator